MGVPWREMYFGWTVVSFTELGKEVAHGVWGGLFGRGRIRWAGGCVSLHFIGDAHVYVVLKALG